MFHRYLPPPARTMKNLLALVDAFGHIDNTEREQQGLDGHSTPGEAWARTAPVPSPVAPPTAPHTALEVLAELTVLGTDYRLGKSYTGDEIDVRWHHTTMRSTTEAAPSSSNIRRPPRAPATSEAANHPADRIRSPETKDRS